MGSISQRAVEGAPSPFALALRGSERDSSVTQSSLAHIKLFSTVPADELASLERTCAWRRYGTGETIIDRDSDQCDVYFIAEGNVRVVNHSLAGREVTLDDIGAGGHFGELAAIDGRPRSATVVALEPSLLASQSKTRFEELLLTHPKVAMAVMRHLVGIVRQSTDRIVGLSTLSSNARVLAEILRLSEGACLENDEAVIRPAPVHAAMANRIGTTRETVARVVNNLARQGVLTRKKDGLYIHNLERLQQLLDDGEI